MLKKRNMTPKKMISVKKPNVPTRPVAPPVSVKKPSVPTRPVAPPPRGKR